MIYNVPGLTASQKKALDEHIKRNNLEETATVIEAEVKADFSSTEKFKHKSKKK